MELLLIFVGLLVALHVPSLVYYVWMMSNVKKAWGIIRDNDQRPNISLIIPTYNEASVIDRRLKNLQDMDYPRDKLQVIIVDSASTDGTLAVCKNWLKKNDLGFPIKLLSEGQRLGKSHALNTALEFADGEIIATSDADSLWDHDALCKAVSFFADPSIGAITGRESLTNLEKTLHTMSEGIYREFYYVLRLGESKIDSTLIFQGELSLYRRRTLEKFEDRAGYSDDTGTVLNIISKGYRCIFVPEAVFHDAAAYSLSGRLLLKSRRAQHLVAGISRALKMKVRRKLALSSMNVAFNFYMHLISPILFIAVVCAGLLVLLSYPILLILVPIASVLLVLRKPRLFMMLYLTNYIALIIGLTRHLIGRREHVWRKVEEMRN